MRRTVASPRVVSFYLFYLLLDIFDKNFDLIDAVFDQSLILTELSSALLTAIPSEHVSLQLTLQRCLLLCCL